MSVASDARKKVGPGRLVLVVGPSGAGKDTLIELVRAHCNDPKIVFARRVVTRAGSSFENNAQLSNAEFKDAMGRGAFALHWQAHGNWYGIPRAIDDDIKAGRIVVANGSRTVIGKARHLYQDVVVVMITAPSEVLAARLAARTRDSDGHIEQRLSRTIEGAEIADITIVNVSSAETHATELFEAIKANVEQSRE